MILMLFTQLYWSLIHDNIRLSSIQRMSKEDWTPYYLILSYKRGISAGRERDSKLKNLF